MSENTDTSIANLPVVNEGRLVFPKFNLQTDSALLIGRNSLDDRVNGAPTVRIDLHTIPDVEIRNPAKVLVASWARRECTSGAIAFASISHIYTQTLRRSCFLRGVGFLGCTLLGLCGNVAIFPPLATAYSGRHGQVILQSATDHEATRSSQEQVTDGNIVVLPYRLPLRRPPFIKHYWSRECAQCTRKGSYVPTSFCRVACRHPGCAFGG